MKRIFFIILLSPLVFFGCQENERMLYDVSNSALNFALPNTTPDSLYVNFMFLPDDLTMETVSVKVDLIGLPIEESRNYMVKVVSDESTAEEGVHYEPLKSVYTFGGGKILNDILELQVIRNPSMSEETYRLVVEFDYQGDFKPGVPEKQFFILNITDNLLVAPPFWKANYLHYRAGAYHWKKCKKFIEIAGVDAPVWYPDPYAALDVYVKKCKIWFEENPTYDEDGNRLYFQ
jgi:hypothetical protein